MAKLKRRSKKSVLIFSYLFAFLIICTPTFNILVDPYSIFLINYKLRRDNHWAYVPGDGGASHLQKAAGIIKFKPNTLMLGSSVVDTGFYLKGNFTHNDATSKLTTIEKISKESGYYPVYNSAVRGGSIETMHQYLKHALINNVNLKHVIIGIELPILFHLENEITLKIQSENFMIGKKHIPANTLFDYSLTKDVTLTSLKCSIIKLDIRNSLNKIKKFSSSLIPKKEINYVQNTEKEIPRKLTDYDLMPISFLGKKTTTEMYFGAQIARQLSNRYKNNKKMLDQNIRELDEMINLLKKHEIDYVVFLSPISPYSYAFMEHSNNFDVVYNLMSEIAKITPFYNFSEIINLGEDYDESIFNGDGRHYSNKVGEILFPYLIGRKNKDKFRVTKDNVSSSVKKMKSATSNFMSNNHENRILFSKIDKNFIESKHSIFLEKYQERYGYNIIKLFDQFYAVPMQKEKYKLIDIISRSNKNFFSSKSFDNLIRKISN
tara:strand:- start:1128 stop:2600 length:1473 start_codon:yes stop_codon:yes gene_type:complete